MPQRVVTADDGRHLRRMEKKKAVGPNEIINYYIITIYRADIDRVRRDAEPEQCAVFRPGEGSKPICGWVIRSRFTGGS